MSAPEAGTRAQGTVGNTERRAGVIVVLAVMGLMSMWVADGLLIGRSLAMPIPALAGITSLTIAIAVMWWIFTKVPYFAPIARTPRWIALLWGALICVGPVLAIEDTAVGAFSGLPQVQFGVVISLFNGATEEVIKGLGILVIFMLVRRPRTLVDGFVIGATVGLGFGLTEGTVYAVRSAWTAGSNGSHAWLGTAMERLIADAFAGHWLYSSVIGVGLAYAFIAGWAGPIRRAAVLTGCVALEIGIHTLNDIGPINAFGTKWSHVFFIIFLADQVLTVGAALLVMRWARNREGEFYVSYLADSGSSVVPTEDLTILPHGATRRHARKAAAKSAHASGNGRGIRRAVRSLHRAEAQLAVAVSAGHTEATAELASLVDHRRAELTAVSAPGTGAT